MLKFLIFRPLYELLLKDEQWHNTFTSGYNNMAGYMVGILYGYIYYKNKNNNLFTKKVFNINYYSNYIT